MRFPIAFLALAVTLPAPLFAAAAAEDSPGEKKEKLICKREVPIGSLIATRKMCLTKTQWEEREKVGSDVARRMIEEGTGRPNQSN